MLRSESYTTSHQPTDTSTNHRNSLVILSSSRITPAFTQKERKGRLFRLLFPSSCSTPDLLLQSLESGFDVRHLLRTATILCHILGVLQHRFLDRAVFFVHGHTAWVFVYMFTSSTPFSIAALLSASGELAECIRTYFTSSTVLFYTLYLHHYQQRGRERTHRRGTNLHRNGYWGNDEPSGGCIGAQGGAIKRWDFFFLSFSTGRLLFGTIISYRCGSR